MLKHVSKHFWLEDSDEDLENDDTPLNKPTAKLERQTDGPSKKKLTYGRKKIRLGDVPAVAGFREKDGSHKSKPLRKSLFSPQKKAARLSKSPGPKAKPKKKTYKRRKRTAVKRWDMGTILKTSNPQDIQFVIEEASSLLGNIDPASNEEVHLVFPPEWTTQQSFRVQGVCLKLGFSKVITTPDEFVLKISGSRAKKIVDDIKRIQEADKSKVAVAASSVEEAPATKSQTKNKKKKKKKKKGKSSADNADEAVELGLSNSPVKHDKRLSFSAAALHRMRRASFAPAQWAMKFSGRGSSSSVRLSCIPALEPIGSAKARLVEDETANPASTHIATLAEGDEDSFDMDLSTESVEECLGAPSNVDMATRRRQSTGRLSISSVPGDVVKGAVGYAVASVFDPLLLSNILDFISFRELIGNCSLVSQSWHHIAVKLASMVVVSRGCDDGDQGDPDNDVVFKSWPHFVEKFPKGSFLAEGGCKQVFRVWSSIMQRWEAIAVINVAAIEDGVAREQFARETECTYLLSNLVAQRVCPNFIELFQVFRFCYSPTERLWGSPKNPQPKRSGARLRNKAPPDSSKGVFQYQRMELCDALDLEEFMRKMPESGHQAFRVEEMLPLMFQMAFSLFAARHQVALCHYDVKLLNFLVQNVRVDSLDDNFEDKASQSTHLGLSYALGDLTFNMGSLPSQWKREPATCRVVKLADFGTSFFDGADSGQESVGGSGEVGLGSSVDDPRFFTTLENTPIDFLILGTDAKQGYEADTWCLGLSFVHLLTGAQPYEETLEDVVCPEDLDAAISQLWLSDASRYRVLAGLDSDYPHVLQDTLYRYLVLLGFGFGTEFTHWPEEWKDLEIFNLLKKHLLAGGDYSESSAQFQRDVEQFAFGRGTDDSMAFATSRLSALDDAWESSIESSKQDNDNASNLKPSAILASLLRFDPTERPTMFEVLRSSLFECLRSEESSANFDFYRNFSFRELPRL